MSDPVIEASEPVEEGAVRPDSLPQFDPKSMYPLQGIIGRVVNMQGASDSYLDPRGPVFFDVKPLPNVPLETHRFIAYQKEFSQAQDNEDGLGYSAYSQIRDEQGYSVLPEGMTTEVKPKPVSFEQ